MIKKMSISWLTLFYLISCLCTVTPTTQIRKPNFVSDFIDSILDKILIGGSTPELDLGPEVGRFSNVSINFENSTKVVDGHKSFGFKLDLNLDKVVVTGNYDLKNIEFPGLFPIQGKGNFEIELNKLDANVLVDITKNVIEDQFEVLLPILNLTLTNSSVNFENLMFDPELSDFMNELISNLIPGFLTIISNSKESLEPFVEYYTNEVYRCIQEEGLNGDLVKCIANIKFPSTGSRKDYDNIIQLMLSTLGKRHLDHYLQN